MSISTLRAGDLAYFDSMGGLVPVRIVRLWTDGPTTRAEVQVTATRKAYRRGDVLETNAVLVIARETVHTRCGNLVIRGNTAFTF